MKIAIIGGSLVGPATELMFRKAGFDDVTTYEAHKTAHVQSGGVMGLRPESLDILRGVGVPTEKLLAIPNQDVISFDLNDNLTWRFRRHDIFPGDTTSWDALHNTLAELTPGIRYGWKVTSLDPNGTLHFENGHMVEPDLVVFADGRKSLGRQILDPNRPHVYQGYMVWRGLTKPPDIDLKGFHRYYDDKYGVLFSLTEPIIQSGLSYWEFSHNLAEGSFHRMTGKLPTERSFLLPHQVNERARRVLGTYADLHLPPRFAELVDGTKEIMGIPINDTATPYRNWWKVGNTRAALVGDALAAVRLQAGAGLNSGLQQAAGLVRWITDSTDLDQSMKEWQEMVLDRYLPWIELGKVRASRTHLGTYTPTLPGQTVPVLAPTGNVWDTPVWTAA